MFMAIQLCTMTIRCKNTGRVVSTQSVVMISKTDTSATCGNCMYYLPQGVITFPSGARSHRSGLSCSTTVHVHLIIHEYSLLKRQKTMHAYLTAYTTDLEYE